MLKKVSAAKKVTVSGKCLNFPLVGYEKMSKYESWSSFGLYLCVCVCV